MIEQFFKERENDDLRLTHGERWLIYNGEWVVYQHLLYKKKTTVEYAGDSLKEALKVLGES